MAKIGKLESGVASHFVGLGGVVIFDKPADYTNATAASLANPKDVGDILEDSFSYTGENVTMESIKNEQGETVVSYAVNGTISYEFTVMSTSADVLKTFLLGDDISAGLDSSSNWLEASAAVGIGDELATFVAPIAFLNQDLNQAILLPKARVTASPIRDGKLLGVKVSVVAEKLVTKNLYTMMVYYTAKANYA
jgi:hypothetical protein